MDSPAGEPLGDGCRGTRVTFERTNGEVDESTRGERHGRATVCGSPGAFAGASLMGRRSPQSVLKRAREQALREKREMKQAKKDARAAARQNGEDPSGRGRWTSRRAEEATG